MSHPHHSSQRRDELRTSARELSGCGVPPVEIAKALKISQAEVLAFLKQNRPLPAQLALFSDDHDQT